MKQKKTLRRKGVLSQKRGAIRKRLALILHRKPGRKAAVFCMQYLLALLALFTWLLFDTWSGNYLPLRSLNYDIAVINKSAFRLVAFTVIAGGLGGVLNGLRSTLTYYNGFNQRYLWKYLAAPWMGATLALFVFALVRSSLVVLGGDAATQNTGGAQILSNFAAGALAGYGAKDVFFWLDSRVEKIFKVRENVPDLTGQQKEAAVSRLHSANLQLGEVSRVRTRNSKRIGTVVNQSPSPKASIERGGPVDLSIASGKRAL
ncbi:MAG TPA: PASTA domain-containing protein [Pyrinomonadaceae bacterium]